MNVGHHKAPTVSVVMTNSPFFPGDSGGNKAQLEKHKEKSTLAMLQQRNRARAELGGRGFTGSLCWARALGKVLKMKPVCVFPQSTWQSSGMSAPFVSCFVSLCCSPRILGCHRMESQNRIPNLCWKGP